MTKYVGCDPPHLDCDCVSSLGASRAHDLAADDCLRKGYSFPRASNRQRAIERYRVGSAAHLFDEVKGLLEVAIDVAQRQLILPSDHGHTTPSPIFVRKAVPTRRVPARLTYCSVTPRRAGASGLCVVTLGDPRCYARSAKDDHRAALINPTPSRHSRATLPAAPKFQEIQDAWPLRSPTSRRGYPQCRH